LKKGKWISSKRVLKLLVVWIFYISAPLSTASAEDGTVSNNERSLSDVKSIAAGPTSGYAIKKDGTAWAWGGGVPLGDGKNTPSSTPIKMLIDHVKQISAGGRHTLILKTDGTVWALGANEHGQLGIGKQSTTIQTKPVEVLGLKDIVAVAAGDNHSLALTDAGLVFAWGGNEDGQLGNATRKNSVKPIEVKGVARVLSITAGKSISIALGGGGEVTIWGLKQVKKGQPSIIRKPTLLEHHGGPSLEFAVIAATGYRAAAIDFLYRVSLWDNVTTGNPGTTLRIVEGLKDVVSITTDNAIKMDGTVWGWTKNKSGKYIVTQIRGITNAVAICKGNGTYYVLLKDGHLLSGEIINLVRPDWVLNIKQ
jgi:alpha-tubulin suppressor-like RCC1 family protein